VIYRASVLKGGELKDRGETGGARTLVLIRGGDGLGLAKDFLAPRAEVKKEP